MRISEILVVALLSGMSMAFAPQVSAQQGEGGKRPNILIILPDDLGWRDIGYNGSEISTPNLDALARTGVRMDQHYVTPTCTPTRVALMTGKYPSRYGVLGPDYGEVIYAGEPTMASILKDNGYETAIAGKWHMGSPPYTPRKYGFQSSYGYLDGQIDPYTHAYKTGRNSWHRDDELIVEEGHATDLITQEAIRVIEAKRTKPFFLYVTYSVPHYPLEEPERWTSLYDHLNLGPSRTAFAASVTHMDDGIGRIVEALERTGQRVNTLIVFMSDNGGQDAWESATQYGGKYTGTPHTVLGNNYPLRGWKVDLYEGGIRVPAFVNWPERVKPGICNAPLHATDWLPTLLRLAGSESPVSDVNGDGRDMWRQITGAAPPDPRRTMYWKTRQGSAVREGDWKLIVLKDGTTELFNLAGDFRERENLSAKEPGKVRALTALMADIASGDRPRKGQ